MIRLIDTDSGAALGTITEEQFRFLAEHLEMESLDDQDYYISQDTLDLLREGGADTDLLEVLGRAVGDREGVEVKWVRA
jgi:hypothetical protein